MRVFNALQNRRAAIFGAFFAAIFLFFSARTDAADAETPTLNDVTARLAAIQKEKTPDLRLDVFDVQTDADAKTARVETTSADAKSAVLDAAADFPGWKFVVKILPEENLELNGRYFGLTNYSTIQLRKKPQYSAELGTQSLMGTPVRILRKESGWLLIQNDDGYLGYTTAGSVKALTRDEFNAWVDSRRLVWVELFGFVYSEPDENSATISDLTVCNVLVWKDGETSGDFYRVETPDGRLGWIKKSGAVEWDEWLATRKFDAESLTSTAKRLLGTPYVWGGASPKGLDCSGLTTFAFRVNRTNILRDVSQLQREGIEVDLSNGWQVLQSGDLLIFGKKRADGSFYYRHVAIYLGDGEFIHSATSVRLNSLDPNAPNYDAYNTRELIKAVRYVGAPNGNFFKPIAENPFYQKK